MAPHVTRVWSRARRALRQALGRLLGRRDPGGAEALRSVFVDDVPEHVDPGRVYVVGEEPAFVVLACPCGCGERLTATLLEGSSVRWRCEVHPDESVTLVPSLWRSTGCRSHFFLRRGEVSWCRP